MVWGLVAHLVADWLLQNDWMANNKAKLGHPAGIIHAGIHAALLLPVFGPPALLLGLAHYLIDLRAPVAWWSKLIRQTQPTGQGLRLVDIGMFVRFWNDQVWHIACIAIAALVVA